MRLEKSIKNLLTAWIGQFLLIFIKFFTRRFFTQFLSDDYLGLEGVFSNVIGLLSLAELGIGTAIGYALFKPLAEKDEAAVKAIMELFARIYRRIGVIVFGLGMLILPFLTMLSPEAKNLEYVHIIFFLYVVNSSVGYFFSYKTTLASANQEYYLYLRNHYIFCICMNLVQIFVLWYFRSYFIFAAVQIGFTISEYICLSKVLDHRYPLLKDKQHYPLDTEIGKKIWQDTKQISISKIGTQIISSTDNLVISNILGLAVAGVYGNYVLIISSLTAIICQVMAAMSASIGNLVAEEGVEKQKDVFWLTMLINTFFYSVTSVCLYNLAQPFIAFWLGGDYLLGNHILLAMVAVYYITGLRAHVTTFKYAYGLFQMEAKKACIEAVLNLGLSIVLAWKIGLMGVVLGTILSALCSGMWMEIVMTVPQMEIRIWKYYLKQIVYTCCTIVALLSSCWICGKLSMHWYIRLPGGAVISVVCTCVMFAVFFCRTHESAELFQIVRNRFLSKFIGKRENRD